MSDQEEEEGEDLEHRDDGLQAARGVILGLILSGAVWFGLFLCWAWIS